MKYAKYLGDLFVLALIVVSLKACTEPAHAGAQSFELILAIYDSDTGHRLELRSYRDVIRVPGFATPEACEAAGDFAQADFTSQRNRRTMANDLLDYQCTRGGK